MAKRVVILESSIRKMASTMDVLTLEDSSLIGMLTGILQCNRDWVQQSKLSVEEV